MKTNLRKREAESTDAILRGLAADFGATSWGGVGDVMDTDAVAQVLDVRAEDVTLLCATGYLKAIAVASEIGIRNAEVIRFMEQHGEWWFRLRGKKQLER
jgi:hypothetical protein